MEHLESRAGAKLLVAEVLVGLATDTTIYLSRRWEALKVNKLTSALPISHGTLGSQGALCFLLEASVLGIRHVVRCRLLQRT